MAVIDTFWELIGELKTIENISYLKTYIRGMDSSQLDQKKKDQVQRADKVEDIISLLCDAKYFMVLDYTNLQSMVQQEGLCNSECTKKLHTYISELTGFFKRRKVSAPCGREHCNSHDSNIQFCVHIDPNHPYFHGISNLKEYVAHILEYDFRQMVPSTIQLHKP